MYVNVIDRVNSVLDFNLPEHALPDAMRQLVCTSEQVRWS